MADKTVVYCKQSGALPIPLTVRIEWLPDGNIRPLMFWMPDGTCFKVTYHSSGIPIAMLKEGGEGQRFDVTGEIIEMTEPYSEIPKIRYETYIYLADSLFCQKNIIDKRYFHARKEYIPVTLDVFPNGDYELIYFSVRGLRYMVENTRAVENGGSFQAGGIGVRHKVEARLVNDDNDESPDLNNIVSRSASVFLELNKWFVAVN